MKNEYSLLDVRAVWIDSYRKGLLDWLSYLESPFFFVKRGDKIMSKREQLAVIDRSRLASLSGWASDLDFNESIEEIRDFSGWSTVFGSAMFSRNGEVVGEYRFFELWIMSEGRWQIASLCYDDMLLGQGS
jgi:hypothetical protein